MSKETGRLIPLAPGRAAENMAIDQALLESVDADQIPILRLYAWAEPTLSLGYFQKAGDRAQHCESTGVDCVRRATGGGALLHHHELTYSIALPLPAGQAGPRIDLYVRTHRAAATALARFGVRAVPAHSAPDDRGASERENPFLCFQRRTPQDLIVSGYKVMGSAQRKTRHAVLQHGSVLLRVSRWAPQLPGVYDLTSRAVPLSEFADEFTLRLGEELSILWRTSEISTAERQRAEEVVRKRFGRADWMLRR